MRVSLPASDPGLAQIDDLASRAWTSSRFPIDGWQARMAAGFTLRANSVLPTGHRGDALDTSVDAVEALFLARGVRPAFQMVPSRTTGLDEELARRGYLRGSEALLMTADVGRSETKRHPGGSVALVARDRAEGPWTAAWMAMAAHEPRHLPAAKRILASVPGAARFVGFEEPSGRLVSVALGIVEGTWLGLFCVVTDPAWRGRGLARALIGDLMAWADESLVGRAYLQVATTNRVARGLYESIGFRPSYVYRYLLAPFDGEGQPLG